MIRRALIEILPFDLHATFTMQLLGKFDPTGSRGAASLRKIHLDARGNLVVWRFTQTPGALSIEVDGDDGSLLDGFTRQFPLNDGADTFEPDHPLLRRLGKGFRGLRLLRMPWTFDVAAGAVLQQRVRWQTAYSDFRRIALRWGMKTETGAAFPTSSQLAAVPIARLESVGLDPKRARALHLLAGADARRAFLHPDADPATVNDRMLSIRGIGPWTAAHVSGFAFGNADAVPVGDLHIPSMVTSALADEPDGTDERMLELLAPYRGQRFRVIRLLQWAARRVPHVFHMIVLFALLSIAPHHLNAQDSASARVTWIPERPVQGTLFRVRLAAPEAGVRVTGSSAGEPLHFTQTASGWEAVAAAPLDRDSTLLLKVQIASDSNVDSMRAIVPLAQGSYTLEKLTVAPQFGTKPDSALQARMARERERALAVSRASHQTPRLWKDILRPRASRITSSFGSGREFNGQIQSRHTGTDFAGATGAPVRAAARGVVALVDTFYLAGRVIYVDHGEGLVSAYFHLSRSAVAVGDTVAAGQQIGLVGATGRVTGPHLHWVVRYGAISVDPLSFLALGKQTQP